MTKTKLRTFEELERIAENTSLIHCSLLELITMLNHGAELRNKNKKYSNGAYAHRAVYNNVSFYCKTINAVKYLNRYVKEKVEA